MTKPVKAAVLAGVGAVLLGAMLAVPAAAGPFEDGLQEYQNGDYQAARRQWGNLAEGDDAIGQFIRGTMCETGIGLARNDMEAVKWYRMAAEQGLAVAQFKLGTMYEKGKGVLQDYSEAANWFRSAANQNFVPAQGSLAILYENGFGVTQDTTQAYIWFDLAENDDDRDRIADSMTPDQITEARRQLKEMRFRIKAQTRARRN